MTPTIELIKAALDLAFPSAEIHVQDDRAEHIGHAHKDSGHFTVIIKSPIFKGKNPIQKHRMVFDALGSLMQTHIHALQIQAIDN
ncbi:MAG: hypothetical protein A3F13_03580 [Gammaproteobacteria bacterium RIFCSPHIGHO2_12_FULL_40_19]|nr:MAG: hypothetical protein A3F13_03580 [Gammaproteobacteria bacterium RIFCSPHIGHO2_12_FULL_40_19]